MYTMYKLSWDILGLLEENNLPKVIGFIGEILWTEFLGFSFLAAGWQIIEGLKGPIWDSLWILPDRI